MSKDWNPDYDAGDWTNQQYPAYPPYISDTSNFEMYQYGNPNKHYNYPSSDQYSRQSSHNQFYGAESSVQSQVTYPLSNAGHSSTDESKTNDSSERASLLLKAVNTLQKSYGGLDVDSNLIDMLRRQMDESKGTESKSSRPEVYSPSRNSASSSPDKTQNDLQANKIISTRPFYEQYNAYESEETEISSKVDQFLSKTCYQGRSRSRERSDRYADRSRSPTNSHFSYYEDYESLAAHSLEKSYDLEVDRRRRSRSSDRPRYSRSAQRRDDGSSRSRSRSNTDRKSRIRHLCDNKMIEMENEVLDLLSMSKSTHRTFVKAQKPSSVLLVMNLETWITDKVLWGAIHSYARKHNTIPPFYIEKATFNFQDSSHPVNLALIAFPSVESAEVCIEQTQCKLTVVGRKYKSYTLMYYNENSILFQVLNYKFKGLWRAVQARQTMGGRSISREKSQDVSFKSSPQKERVEEPKRVLKNEECVEEMKTKDKETSVQNANTVPCNTDKSRKSDGEEDTDSSIEATNKAKLDASTRKRNVMTGRMKAYLIKQHKSNPESESEEDETSSEEKKIETHVSIDAHKSKEKVSIAVEKVKKEPNLESADENEKVISERNYQETVVTIKSEASDLNVNSSGDEKIENIGQIKDDAAKSSKRQETVKEDDEAVKFKASDEDLEVVGQNKEKRCAEEGKSKTNIELKSEMKPTTAEVDKRKQNKSNTNNERTTSTREGKDRQSNKRKLSPERDNSRHSRARRDGSDSRRSRSRDRYARRSHSRERYRRNRSPREEVSNRLRDNAKRRTEGTEKMGSLHSNHSRRDSKLQKHGDYYNKRRSELDDGKEDDFSSQTKKIDSRSSAPGQEQTECALKNNEAKNPESYLRILLQTSILIQNNQLIMANPTDSLSPTEKEQIIETLKGMEETSQEVITATLMDKTKFNAAEQRVLIEALSNINSLKEALLPPPAATTGDENMELDYDSEEEAQKKNIFNSVYVIMNNIKPFTSKRAIIDYITGMHINFEYIKVYPVPEDKSPTSGYIKFKNLVQANDLLTQTKYLFIGNDKEGIELRISNVIETPNHQWSCKFCPSRNSFETHVCKKCQKLRGKLRDVESVTQTTDKLILINFKNTTTVEDVRKVLSKIAPTVNLVKIVLHVDSSNEKVHHFIAVTENKQASNILRKGIMENLAKFAEIRAGPKIFFNFVAFDTPVGEISTPEIKNAVPSLPGMPVPMPPMSVPVSMPVPMQGPSTNSASGRVYTFADVPRLAEYSASMYAQNDFERMNYYRHYSALYTQQLVKGIPINVVLPEDVSQTSRVPNGTDGRQWPPPNEQSFIHDSSSGYYYDNTTGLYYEKSSKYFYNMELGKFLQYDPIRYTYTLVQTSEISSAPVKVSQQEIQTTPNVAPTPSVQNVADTPKPEETKQEKINPPAKESKIRAKKVMKDLEKWAKSVQKMDKRKAVPTSTATSDNELKGTPADVCFDILRKTEKAKPSAPSVPQISSLILENVDRCEEEVEEYAFIDFQNSTCNLCHRVFNSVEILNKHSKISELHRNNLRQWYISKNLDPDNEENRKKQYKERALSRRKAITNTKAQVGGNSPPESWLCSTPLCMAYKRSGFDTCLTCEKRGNSRPESLRYGPRAQQYQQMAVGSKMLKKMGWEQGTSLGRK